MNIRPQDRTFITGKTRTGKTVFAKALARKFRNLIIYDIKREYGKEFGRLVRNLDELKDALTVGKHRCIVVQPYDPGMEAFDEVAEFVFWNLKNVVFLVDEVHNYCKKAYIPPGLKRIITMGASESLGFVGVSQRCANVHNDILANCEHIVSFYQFLDNDISKLAGFIGSSAEKLRNLPPYHFLYFNSGGRGVSFHKPLPIGEKGQNAYNLGNSVQEQAQRL